MDLQVFLTSILTSGVLSALIQHWLTAGVEGRIRLAYDQRMASYKADLDRQLVGYKADLDQSQQIGLIEFKNDFAKQSDLHSAARASFADAHKAAMERRLKAVDTLWTSMSQIAQNSPSAFTIIDALTVESYRGMKGDPVFENLLGAYNIESIQRIVNTDVYIARPYLGETIYAIYDAFHTLTLRRVTVMAMRARTSDEDLIQWYLDSPNRSIITKVLSTGELGAFDALTSNQWAWLRRQLEFKLLAEIDLLISGKHSGAASFKYSSDVFAAIDSIAAADTTRQITGNQS